MRTRFEDQAVEDLKEQVDVDDGLEEQRPDDELEDQRLDQFRRRVLQDALAHGTATYWRRRAATFEQARPRPGDYVGTAGQQRLDEIDAGLIATRDACLQRAQLAALHHGDLDLT